MNKTESPSQLDWIDALRVLATFSVILLHVASRIIYQNRDINSFEWWVANIYESSTQFCIPVFLMISGALILNKTYNNISEFLKKRFLRIVFPFLFWGLAYIFRDLFIGFYRGEELSFGEKLNFILVKFKNGPEFHFWFVYLIIGLYLIFPIFSRWINNSKRKEIEYFIGIWFLTLIFALPLVKPFVPVVNLTYFSGFIGFPVLGYYLKKYELNFNRKKTIYILSILTGILFTALATFLITRKQGSWNPFFYGYLTPNVILVAVAVFLFFRDFVRFGTKTTAVIRFFSRYSYGVYLAHVLVLQSIYHSTYDIVSAYPIIGIPLVSILGMIISTLIVYGIHKLPFGKYVSG